MFFERSGSKIVLSVIRVAFQEVSKYTCDGQMNVFNLNEMKYWAVSKEKNDFIMMFWV